MPSLRRHRTTLPRLSIEALESRLLLACVVDRYDDPPLPAAGMSLRECVELNNQGGNPTLEITFDSVPNDIKLVDSLGPLQVNRDVVIMDMPLRRARVTGSVEQQGARQAPQITIYGSDNTRLFNIESTIHGSVTATFDGLMLSEGDATNGTTPHAMDGLGGAILNSETLILRNSVVTQNSASQGGGAIAGLGGSLIIEYTTVSDNDALNGGGIHQNGGTIDLAESHILQNNGADDGGGLSLVSVLASINSSTISGNTAGDSFIEPFGDGGGLFVAGASQVYLSNSDISGNLATNRTGGGVYARGSGGIFPTVTISNSSIHGNTGEAGGGGLASRNAQVQLNQSTVSGNATTNSFSRGSGILVTASSPADARPNLFDRMTLAFNAQYATTPGSGFYGDDDADVTIVNSILSGNDGADLNGTIANPDGTATLPRADFTPSVSYSLVAVDGTGQLTDGSDGNIVGTAATLAPLAVAPGAFTPTHALMSGDISIDGATRGEGTGELDQSGFGPRDVGGRMDMGAREYRAAPVNYADFNQDGTATCTDIDALSVAIAAGTHDPLFDLNSDGLVNDSDVAEWLTFAGGRPEHFVATGGRPFPRGDLNLDGAVDGADFVVWNQNKFGPGVYCDGDFNSSGFVDGADFVIWNDFKFTSAIELIVDVVADVDDGDLAPGELSLREAIIFANNRLNAQTITFDSSLANQTINVSQRFDLTDSVTIDALGLNLTIDAGHGVDGIPATGDGSRIFFINDDEATNQEVTLRGFEITGGDRPFDGGGIQNRESLTLDQMVLRDNHVIGAAERGGGIHNVVNGSVLTIVDSLITENSTESFGGGFSLSASVVNVTILRSTISGNSSGSAGGGVFTRHDAGTSFTITDSYITANVAGGDGGGFYGRHNVYGAPLATINGTQISGNSTDADGGGVFARRGALTLAYSTVEDNTADDDGGGVFNFDEAQINNSTISGNEAADEGGGVFNYGSLAIATSVLSANSTGDRGGAVYASGDLDITDSTLSGNSASTSSGALRLEANTTSVVRSTISGNSATNIGGIYNDSGYLTIVDSTISFNTANSTGGIRSLTSSSGLTTISNSTISSNTSIGPTGYGGGIRNNGGPLVLSNATVTENSAIALGAGIANTSASASTTLENTIVAGNQAANDLRATNGAADFTSLGHNLVGGGDTGAFVQSGDIVLGAGDPMLGALQDNGGPTFTHALLPASPAIDAGDPSFNSPPDFDQRGVGFDRVVGGRIDIGAFEVQAGSRATHDLGRTDRKDPRNPALNSYRHSIRE